jgi:hypothetical protein
MEIAIKDNQPIKASAGLRATCRDCGAVVVAKCGTQRIHHWAHYGVRDCDTWAENETEWHRAWKNQFSEEWREVGRRDESGELHRADVRTALGLTIEFQYSHLNPEERVARERFYGDMVWVVDGTRRKRDFPRFKKNFEDASRNAGENTFRINFPEECFPSDWLESSAPVLFDFMGMAVQEAVDPMKDALWCLLPGRENYNAYVLKVARSSFVQEASNMLRPFEAPTNIQLKMPDKRVVAESHLPPPDINRMLLMLRQQQLNRRRFWR